MRITTAAAAAVRSSLKLKLIAFIVVILGLTIGIAPWSAIKMQEHQLLQASQARLEGMQELLKTVVTSNMLAEDREHIQRVIEVLASHEQVERVRIVDTEGVIRFSSRPEERGSRLSAAEQSRYHGLTDPSLVVRERETATHTLLQPIFNQPVCFRCHPSEQKVIGILQIGLSLGPMERELGALKRSAMVATLVTLGVIVIGIWLSLTWLVDQPLQKLVEVIERAAQGDFTARAETRQKDEIGKLARRFNDMIAKLQIAQQELERYHQDQLARADRLATLGEMAAAIAHEIRNPLTGISGVLSVLSRDFPGDDPRREVVRQTHLLIERLNKTVQDILHYARPSLPQFQTVKLADVVDRALSLVAGEATKARIRIVREAAPGVGASLTVHADAPQVQQVLINLVLNAIQASAAGADIRVRTYLRENDGQRLACVDIEDSGKGMTPEQAAKAFHPFFSTKAQGTGLGLAIAKQIIEQHHGQISLRSAPGQGTCVEVCLPMPDDTMRQGA
jgi:two-component system NtrC family sensor kinase